jgi:hypothetical protein
MNAKYLNIKGFSAAITPNDNKDIDYKYSDGVYVESAGNVAVTFKDGSTHTFTGLVAKDTIQGEIARISSTGTTVTAGEVYTFALVQ